VITIQRRTSLYMRGNHLVTTPETIVIFFILNSRKPIHISYLQKKDLNRISKSQVLMTKTLNQLIKTLIMILISWDKFMINKKIPSKKKVFKNIIPYVIIYCQLKMLENIIYNDQLKSIWFKKIWNPSS